jgi:hypothetical protein
MPSVPAALESILLMAAWISVGDGHSLPGDIDVCSECVGVAALMAGQALLSGC